MNIDGVIILKSEEFWESVEFIIWQSCNPVIKKNDERNPRSGNSVQIKTIKSQMSTFSTGFMDF